MDRPPLSLPADALRARVVETVRRHWIRPVFPDNPLPVPRGAVEDVSRAALDAMLTRPFRVGPLPPPKVYDRLLKRVRGCVRQNRPLKVTLGYGPLKNQHAVPYSRADWAEFFALCHLAAWHKKVQAVYAPGLRVQIVFDDSTLAIANRADQAVMRSYMDSFPPLIRALGFDELLPRPFAQSSFSWTFHIGLYPIARFLVWRWERNPANRDQLARMEEYARRNVMVPPHLAPEDQERFVRAAAHRYRVYWEALQVSSIFWGHLKLIAMYLDGSQHHHRQSVALHLTTLDKGQITQPWQGEGALVDNGHGRLEPFVLTAGRRPRHTTRSVDGLDLIPCPGFDRLTVAVPLAPATVDTPVNEGAWAGPVERS